MTNQEYHGERKLLVSLQTKQLLLYDILLSSLAAGALFFSMVLGGKIPLFPGLRELLHFTWLFFVLSLLSVLLSQLCGQLSATIALKNLHIFMYQHQKPLKRNIACYLVWAFNWAAIFWFVWGTFSLLYLLKTWYEPLI